jgi:regulator of cell morphogenesis and NO signaling
MKNLLEQNVADIALENVRTIPVFEQYHVDYCCHGRRPLGEALRELHVSESQFLHDFEEILSQNGTEKSEFNKLALSDLIDHIENKHHRYLQELYPILTFQLDKLWEKHGERHPELKHIRLEVAALFAELLMHLQKEEQILFPVIKKMENGIPVGLPIHAPIQVMEHEHDDAGDALARLRKLTNNYTPPEDGCGTYQVAFKELAELEADLHQHIHLENNLLFTKALKLYQS